MSESHNTFGRCRPRRIESTGPYCSLKSMRKMNPIATGAIIIGIVKTMRKNRPPGIFRQRSSASVRPMTYSQLTATTTRKIVNFIALQKSLSCSSCPH